MRASLRASQPNFFLPFDRAGIDPLTQRFPVTLRLEGTVRGTGGLRIASDECATNVPGLFAAGDAATRELICGGFTGGGSHNAAWAISSGHFAGSGAARHAAAVGTQSSKRDPRAAGRASFVEKESSTHLDTESVVAGVQAEVFPYDKNLFRTRAGLLSSLGQLESLWQGVQGAGAAGARAVLRRREAAAMTATARWMYSSALERTETRGMHKHMDHPGLDPAQQRRLVCGGLDSVWVRPEAAPAAEAPIAAE